MNLFEYGSFTDLRNECFKKFGTIFDLPIISDPYSEVTFLFENGNILDLGAGKDIPFYKNIQSKIQDGKYYSLDNDPHGTFNFRYISEIPITLKFSLVFANQFFEHLHYEDALNTASELKDKICDGGYVGFTVPNISHPNRYWGDFTHVTPWNYNNLYMLVKFTGCEVIKIARYSKRHPQGLIEKIITKYVSRVYRMDWCDSILIIGRKNGRQSEAD